MNKLFLSLIGSGVLLLCLAAFTAMSLPSQVEMDLDNYIKEKGGSIQYTQVSESFLRNAGTARALRNLWIGSSGLVLFGSGLLGMLLHLQTVIRKPSV